MNQITSEIIWLKEKILLLNPRNIAVEIGVFEGGTFIIFTHLFKKVIGIDIEKKDLSFKLRDEDQYIIGNSRDQNIISKIDNKSIDFLFIDGDHSYEGIKGDFFSWKPKIRKGGLIAIHDINGVDLGGFRDLNVMTFWNELKESNKYKIEEKIDHKKYFGIGLIWL